MDKDELKIERNKVQEILEDFSEELSHNNRHKLARVFNFIDWEEKRIAELEAQLANKGDCECLTCVCRDSPCTHSDYGKDEIGLCKCYKSIYELHKDLEKENAELRKDKKELCHSISEGGKACVYLNEQLTKAKEIIKKLYTVYYDPCVTESDLKYRDELFAEIKQFLSEVEK